MMPWDGLQSPTKSAQASPGRYIIRNSGAASPPRILETRTIQGYSSHNPYDSYIPEDNFGGNTGTKFTGPKLNHSPIQRPSRTYKLNQFDDYTSQNPKVQAPARTYQINPSPAKSILPRESTRSRIITQPSQSMSTQNVGGTLTPSNSH